MERLCQIPQRLPIVIIRPHLLQHPDHQTFAKMTTIALLKQHLRLWASITTFRTALTKPEAKGTVATARRSPGLINLRHHLHYQLAVLSTTIIPNGDLLHQALLHQQMKKRLAWQQLLRPFAALVHQGLVPFFYLQMYLQCLPCRPSTQNKMPTGFPATWD